jgi:hypothetical protein
MPANDSNTPYISVVVAARNDDHGGNMLGRMQAFLDSWIVQAQRYNLPSEIVVVEWNPPSQRPRLQKALRFPAGTDLCPVRFVEVSAEVHQTIPNALPIPLHQMIAKNVGIRRARGQYILVSNLDIIFSAELMQYFAARRLEPGVIYRMDRWDIASEIPVTRDVDELLRFSHANLLRIFAREGIWDVAGDRSRPVEHKDILAPDIGIRLGYGWYGLEAYDELRLRYTEAEAEILFERPPTSSSRMIFDAEVGPSAQDGWVKLEILDPERTVLTSAVITGRVKLRLSLPSTMKSGRFLVRVVNGGVPLVREPRMLDLRFFRIQWSNTATSGTTTHETAAQEAGTTITKEFNLDVVPDKGYSVDTLDVIVTDGSGNTVSFAAEPSELDVFAKSPDYRINLHVGFRPEGEADRFNPGRTDPENASKPGWRLEVVGRIPGVDWSKLRQAANPYAKFIRKAANLHTFACGDFTAMARDHWFQLRAYPEFPIWPMHIDSLLCYIAYHAGIREEILREPMQIFHIQHFNAAGWTPEGQAELDARVARKNVPTMHYEEMLEYIDHMRRFDTPIIFSPPNWGLADLALPESVV